MGSKPKPPPSEPAKTGAVAPAGKGKRVRGRKRRIARWCIRIGVGVPLILIAASLIIANSPWVRSIVDEQLTAATGCTVEMGHARVELDGRIIIRDLKLRVPGLAGPAGELLLAERADVDLNWSAALSWAGLSAVQPTSIRLTKPVFRISQSLDDGSLNIGGLAVGAGGSAPGGTGSSAAISIPTVNVQDGQIELVEYSTKLGRYEVLNTIHVAGVFSSNADGSYRVRMQEIGRLPPPRIEGEPVLPRGMILDGRVDLQNAEAMLKLLNLPLEAWPPESVPTSFRETWRRLRIQGRIRETMFTYDRSQGVKLSVWPEDVAMDIPVPEDSTGAASDLSLSRVNGEVTLSRDGLTAELEGVFEDQTKPVHVKLKTEGPALNAPLVCEIWGEGLTLARNPGFLPYIPATAREFFVFFSGPTGEVDARVMLVRGVPIDGAAAPVVLTDGRLNVRNGTAAFHMFPYPIHNMEVKATFDENHLNLLDIRGDGPTGAKLRASSQAAPMTDLARVDVSVHVSDVPIDEHLRAAMPGSRKQLLEVVFNEERYAQLLAEGLIRAGDAAPEEGAAPPFALGGMCEIDVTVTRPYGEEVEWSTDVVVRIAEAGVVPLPFPFPIIARDVELRITDTEGTLTRGTFTGLRGGRADLSAHVLLMEGDQNVLKPRLEIAAFDVPVDELLIHAVPDDETAGDPGAVSAKAILRRLDIRGGVDCSASIREADDGTDDVDYDVAVNLKDIDARPRELHPETTDLSRLVVTGASGRIRVRPDRVQVEDLTGRLVAEDRLHPLEDPLGTVESAGTFLLELEAEILRPIAAPDVGPPAPSPIGAVNVKVEARDLDLAAPLPSLLAVFNAEVAAEVAKLREQRTPFGRLDAELDLERPTGAARPTVAAKFSRFVDVSFAALAGRVCLLNAVGDASFVDRDDPDPRRRTSFVFDSFSASVEYAGESAGSIDLHGRLSLDPDAPVGSTIERALADAELDIGVRDARFESPMMRDVLALALSPATQEDWRELDVQGVFDLHAQLVGEPVVAMGLIGPREVSFVRGGVRAVLPSMFGHVAFLTVPDPDGGEARRIEGRLEELGCRHSQWRASTTGAWSFAPGEGFTLDTVLDVEGQSLSDDLLALLPVDASAAMRAVDLRIDGGFSMPEAHLFATIPDAVADGDAGSAEVRFEAEARFASASVDVGLPIRECDGQVHVLIEDSPLAPASMAIEFESPGLRMAGLSLQNARALLVSENNAVLEDGELDPVESLVLPYFTADCHTGRIWGNATIGPATGEDGAREFSAAVVAAGVLFAPLLDELESGYVVQGPDEPAVATIEEPGTPHEPRQILLDRTRGQADMWFCLSGRSGDVQSRLGRGAMRVANGDVLRLPVVFPLVQMSNLMLPNEDRFDYLQAEFHLHGQTAIFDNIALLSDSVSLMGDGTVTLPDLDLDMRFNSRSNKRVPLLSDMYEALRDEILTTRVRGTVAEPDIRSETLTTTRSILDSLFDPGREQHGSIGSDGSARREQTRVNSVQRPEPPLPPTTFPSRPTGVDG